MPPGCTAVARTPLRLVPAVELDGEQDVGGLRAAVGAELGIGRALEIRDRRDRRRRSGGRPTTGSPAARPASAATAMRLTNTKWPRWLVPNWVSKPSAVWPFGRRHDAGVGDDEVERLARRDQRVGAGAHAGERGEVELDPVPAPPPFAAPARPARSRPSALSRSRAAPTTWAPCAASARAVSTPRPAETPVTRTRLPREVDALEHLVGGRCCSKCFSHGFLRCLALPAGVRSLAAARFASGRSGYKRRAPPAHIRRVPPFIKRRTNVTPVKRSRRRTRARRRRRPRRANPAPTRSATASG